MKTPPASSGKVVEVPLPLMGESVSQGVLAKWNIEVGSVVNAGDILASVETDKVTIDIQSPHSGKVLKLYAPQGSEVQVGKPFLLIEEGVGSAPAPKKEAAPASAPTPAAATPAPAAPAKKVEPSAAIPAPKAAPPTPERVLGDRSENRVKMTRMRQRIAERFILMDEV